MPRYDFALIVAGLDAEADDFEDRLYEAGCDDATPVLQKGAVLLEFGRDARNFAHALASAMADVEQAGGQVVGVAPDHLVTLADIAARTELTRAALSHYAKGARGVGFPAPVARVTSENPLWDWAEVARWFHRQGRLDRAAVVRARLIRDATLALRHRQTRRVA